MTEYSFAGALRVLSIVLFVGALAACDNEDQQAGRGPGGPLPVDVSKPLVREIVEWDEFTGRFEAVERIEIRARVSGYLQGVHFKDGQVVQKGDLLFTIDPRPFEAELARARAGVRQAEIALDLANKELKRAEKLLGSRNISEETVDSRRAAKLGAEAELSAARAVARSAQLDLEFTRVEAPATGRISERKVDIGNLVSGGDAQSPVLALLVSLDPIYFVFDASEADYLKYTRLDQSGQRPSSRDTANPVQVRLVDESEWKREGKMDFVDSVFNRGSGTIRARAVFDNPDHLLAPGLFGRLRLVGSGAYVATLLPDSAILADQSRKIVYVVDEAGTVTVRLVTVGPVIDGLRVIRSGVGPSDRVVVSGLQRARPGGKVTPNTVEIDPETGKFSPTGSK